MSIQHKLYQETGEGNTYSFNESSIILTLKPKKNNPRKEKKLRTMSLLSKNPYQNPTIYKRIIDHGKVRLF